MSTLLFVYGTLKRGRRRNESMTRAGAHYLGEVRTAPRFGMFRSLGTDYPAMVEMAEGGAAIEGELWEVPDAGLAVLDAVEGVPDLFQRTQIQLADGRVVAAYLMSKKPWFARNIGTSF